MHRKAKEEIQRRIEEEMSRHLGALRTELRVEVRLRRRGRMELCKVVPHL